MFTYSYINFFHTFTITTLIAELTVKLIKDTRSKTLNYTALSNLVLFLKLICNFFNLVLVCKNTEPTYGRTRVRKVVLTYLS